MLHDAGSALGNALLAGVVVLLVGACASGGPDVADEPMPGPGADRAETDAVPGLRPEGDPMEPLVVRPVPAPVVPPSFYRAALEAGTRSPDGSPGPEYWRNHAAYDIEASLDPETARLEGRETIVYTNHSPRTLDRVVLHLHQNLHAEGVRRGEAQEVTGGVDLGAVRVDGAEAADSVRRGGPFFLVEGTLMLVAVPSGVEPGGSVELELEWGVTIPQSGAGRMGWSDREMYYLGYWFPKVAVYDDLRGWDAEPYLGGAEFYDEFGDYDVRLTVPEGWTVMATGELRNPRAVYRPAVLERLEAAANADTVVTVADIDDRLEGSVTVDDPDDRLTYRFTAENVRDFAWTTSSVQRWDATSAVVPDRDGDGREDRVLIHSFWRQDRAPLWADQAVYGKQSVEFHSRYTGLAYPWPHMTSVEGDQIIGGGMEFPMMTVMGPYRGREASDLFNVTSHEIAHMWIPMIVGTNEKRYAWMDEGSTTFLENRSREEYYPGSDPDPDAAERQSWLDAARMGLEQPLMRHGDYYEPGPGYGVASYPKPASLLVALRALIGPDTFRRAYRAFVDEWAYGHPTPWDLFNTVERFAGRDLDWWWTSFYFETWTLDHAVAGVERRPDGRRVVVVEDRGWAVAPAEVRVRTDERTFTLTVPVRRWLEGRERVEVLVPEEAGAIRRVEVDPDPAIPDIDRANNVWEAGGAGEAGGGELEPDDPGRLVIVGGGLSSDNDAVYRAVVEAREGEGPLCVLPTASGVPERSMQSVVERLAEVPGADSVVGVFVTESNADEADSPGVAERLRSCSGFWFTGGVQSRVVDVFLPEGRRTAGYDALVERHRAGAVVAGTSAGAAMMPRRMIAGGGSEAALEHGVRGRGDDGGDGGVLVMGGMGFFDGPVVDQHFLARGRVGRLLVATLAGEGGGVGLGIDENTALVVDGDRARVVGASGVLLVDARNADRTGAGHGGRGVTLRLFGDGDVLDLGTLAVEASPENRPLAPSGASVEAPADPFAREAFGELLEALARSADDGVELEAAGHRFRLVKGPGFEARARDDAALSAGPWRLDVLPGR